MGMRRFGAFGAVRFVAFVVLASVFFGLVIEHLWNWLMPGLFGLRTLDYWHAVGLFVLAKLLLGGFHHGGGRHREHRGWKRHMKERWATMTPEERERLRAGMRGRHGCRWDRSGWDRPQQEAETERAG